MGVGFCYLSLDFGRGLEVSREGLQILLIDNRLISIQIPKRAKPPFPLVTLRHRIILLQKRSKLRPHPFPKTRQRKIRQKPLIRNVIIDHFHEKKRQIHGYQALENDRKNPTFRVDESGFRIHGIIANAKSEFISS